MRHLLKSICLGGRKAMSSKLPYLIVPMQGKWPVTGPIHYWGFSLSQVTLYSTKTTLIFLEWGTGRMSTNLHHHFKDGLGSFLRDPNWNRAAHTLSPHTQGQMSS